MLAVGVDGEVPGRTGSSFEKPPHGFVVGKLPVMKPFLMYRDRDFDLPRAPAMTSFTTLRTITTPAQLGKS
jgi:hypothetical protein